MPKTPAKAKTEKQKSKAPTRSGSVKKKQETPASITELDSDDDVIKYAQGLVHSSYGVLYGYVQLELKKPPSKRTWRDIEKQAGVCAGWLDKFIKAAGLDKE